MQLNPKEQRHLEHWLATHHVTCTCARDADWTAPRWMRLNENRLPDAYDPENAASLYSDPMIALTCCWCARVTLLNAKILGL